MEVLKQTSPSTSPSAPNAFPSKTVPSSRASFADWLSNTGIPTLLLDVRRAGMSNHTAYTASSHSFCPFSQFYPQRSPPGKVLAPTAPIVAVRLWVSELPTVGISDSQLESSCPGEQELSFFVSIRPSNVQKTGPSIRPLNDFPRPVSLCRPFSRPCHYPARKPRST